MFLIPALDNILQADESAAADKEDIRRIDLQKLLMRMLAPALRRHAGNRSLQNFQQRLLHTLTRDISGDRGALALSGNLVDLVNIDNACLLYTSRFV